MASVTFHPTQETHQPVQGDVQNENKSFARSLYDVFKRAIQGFVSIIAFPVRYLGSKTWSILGVIQRSVFAVFRRVFTGKKITSDYILGKTSGYSQKSQPLPKEKGEEVKPYAYMVAFAHNDEAKYLQDQGYLPLLVSNLGVNFGSKLVPTKDFILFNKESGLKLLLTENVEKNEIVIAFGALKSSQSILVDQAAQNDKIKKAQYMQVGYNYLGFLPSLYKEADSAIQKILQSDYVKGKKVTLAGQCLGGSLAQYVGIKRKQQTYSFNCLPMGCGIQYHLGSEKLANADKYVTLVHVEGDFLNKNYRADDFLNTIGLKTPGNFGKCYKIPSDPKYKEPHEVHNNFLGSFKHWKSGVDAEHDGQNPDVSAPVGDVGDGQQSTVDPTSDPRESEDRTSIEVNQIID